MRKGGHIKAGRPNLILTSAWPAQPLGTAATKRTWTRMVCLWFRPSRSLSHWSRLCRHLWSRRRVSPRLKKIVNCSALALAFGALFKNSTQKRGVYSLIASTINTRQAKKESRRKSVNASINGFVGFKQHAWHIFIVEWQFVVCAFRNELHKWINKSRTGCCRSFIRNTRFVTC